jgi:hypothetical protein
MVLDLPLQVSKSLLEKEKKKEVSEFAYSTLLIYGGNKVKEKRRYKGS